MPKFIVHFEPMDIEAEDLKEVEQLYNYMNQKPTILRILLSRGIDRD